MAFPGGKKDEGDESLLHTALRELNEEVGLSLPTEKKYFRLNEIFIPPSRMLVQPFATVLNEMPNFIRYDDYLIWGATAMMLFELRDRLDLKNKYE